MADQAWWQEKEVVVTLLPQSESREPTAEVVYSLIPLWCGSSVGLLTSTNLVEKPRRCAKWHESLVTLQQQLSTFLGLQPFDAVPHAGMTPVTKLFRCYFRAILLLLLGIVI